MRNLTEFEKVELVWQDPQSPKQLNCLIFRELYHIKDCDGIQEELKKLKKTVGLPSLPTQTDVY